MSLSSAEKLRELLSSEIDIFRKEHVSDDDVALQVQTLLLASLQLPEIRRGLLARDVPLDAHVEPVLRWIAGDSYEAILETCRTSGALSKSAKVGEAVKYCADASTWVSWGVGAAYFVLVHLGAE